MLNVRGWFRRRTWLRWPRPAEATSDDQARRDAEQPNDPLGGGPLRPVLGGQAQPFTPLLSARERLERSIVDTLRRQADAKAAASWNCPCWPSCAEPTPPGPVILGRRGPDGRPLEPISYGRADR